VSATSAEEEFLWRLTLIDIPAVNADSPTSSTRRTRNKERMREKNRKRKNRKKEIHKKYEYPHSFFFSCSFSL